MGSIFSFIYNEFCIGEGHLTDDETTALINRQAYRLQLKRHVENMPNVRNVDELVEQLLNEMPTNFFVAEEPTKIVYVPSTSKLVKDGPDH